MELHYIGGTDVLPAPLGVDEENAAILELGTEKDEDAKNFFPSICNGFETFFEIFQKLARNLHITKAKDTVKVSKKILRGGPHPC